MMIVDQRCWIRSQLLRTGASKSILPTSLLGGGALPLSFPLPARSTKDREHNNSGCTRTVLLQRAKAAQQLGKNSGAAVMGGAIPKQRNIRPSLAFMAAVLPKAGPSLEQNKKSSCKDKNRLQEDHQRQALPRAGLAPAPLTPLVSSREEREQWWQTSHLWWGKRIGLLLLFLLLLPQVDYQPTHFLPSALSW